jgi:NTP pyrophosphatase (non-canonical NTP hydrolase)
MFDELTFAELSAANASRRDRWHQGGDPWTCSDWSNALAGEVGEACNLVKKVRRHETAVDKIAGGQGSYNTPEMEELVPKIADEIADVILYADLLATHFGINVEDAVRAKFNRVSEAQDFPERL